MHEAWISLGASIRFAQEIGVHRQHKFKTESDRVEAEQWKRCFWSVGRVLSLLACSDPGNQVLGDT